MKLSVENWTARGWVSMAMPLWVIVLLAAAFEILPATNSAELRSVASLRALTADFLESANTTITEYADKPHALKAKLMWDFLEEAYAEEELEEKDRLICFFAATPDLPTNPLAAAMRQQMDLSSTLPAEGSSPPRIVIGSLDLNRGITLDAEHLAGQLPESKRAANWGRAYLSNIGVAHAARRMGVASALIAAAHRHASQIGVRHLYVHSARTNLAALSLYGKHCGFEVEQEEDADFANAMQRPQRVLFHKTVLDADLLASDLSLLVCS